MDNFEKNPTEAFQYALSQHGYSFQYAVLKAAEHLYDSHKSPWIPWVPEFPVEVQGTSTRIDLIFYHPRHQLFMVCECKRANPANSNWCFARTPQLGDSGFASQGYVEMVRYDGNCVKFGLRTLCHSDRIFQIALSVKTGKSGDRAGAPNDQIEAAATQVSRGTNGLIQFLSGKRVHTLININQPIGFLPVIFTTASIWSTSAEVSSLEITTGASPTLDPELGPIDWLWYDYPQSPGIRHDLPDENPSSHLQEIYYRESVRRIAFVSAQGIGAFLGSGLWR